MLAALWKGKPVKGDFHAARLRRATPGRQAERANELLLEHHSWYYKHQVQGTMGGGAKELPLRTFGKAPTFTLRVGMLSMLQLSHWE